ncbi:MAG: gamma-glutamyl-phosphate reductase, partial [Clostridia bacterium]
MNISVNDLCLLCKKNIFSLSSSSSAVRNAVLVTAADMLCENKEYILKQNKKDLDVAQKNGVKEAFVDRLSLSSTRIDGMANGMRQVALLADPCGSGDVRTRPNGL